MTLIAFVTTYPFATALGLGVGLSFASIVWATIAADYEGR